MSDDITRRAERGAHNDPAARVRLQHQRCRALECCAHAIEHTGLPVLPQEAEDALLISNETILEAMPVLSQDGAGMDFEIHLRFFAPTAHAAGTAVHWFREAFPAFPRDYSRGLPGVPPTLGGILYGIRPSPYMRATQRCPSCGEIYASAVGEKTFQFCGQCGARLIAIKGDL